MNVIIQLITAYYEHDDCCTATISGERKFSIKCMIKKSDLFAFIVIVIKQLSHCFICELLSAMSGVNDSCISFSSCFRIGPTIIIIPCIT